MENEQNSRFFVGIGAMRCATTWVANILDLHPQIYFSPIKELHYFNYKYRDKIAGRGKAFRRFYRKHYGNFFRRIRTRRDNPELAKALEKRSSMKCDDNYREYFKEGKLFRAFGEITPGYSLLPEEGFKNIKDLFPEARIIFGMRDPADRMWSHWHKVNKQRKRRKEDRFTHMDPEDFTTFMANHGVFERARYDNMLERVLKVFELEDVFTYFYEDLFYDDESTENFITDLYTFLGVDPFTIHEDKYQKRWDPTSVGEIPADLRRVVMKEYRPMIERVHDRLGRVPERWLR